MIKAVYFFLVLNILSGTLLSKTIPSEDAQLHYRIIGFSFPGVSNTQIYELEVAKGKHKTESSFREALLFARTTATNSIIAEVPLFGCDYTWRVVAKGVKNETKSPFYHFSTGVYKLRDSTDVRIRITKVASTYNDAYFFADNTGAMYNMAGMLVWFIPDAIVAPESKGSVTDLKATPQGTITFLHLSMLHEITYDGRVLRKIPEVSSTPSLGLHHNATRLKNGHYMALGAELISWKQANGTILTKPGLDSLDGYQPNPFDVIKEYDDKGGLVWQFKLADYVLHSDIMNKWDKAGMRRLDAHANAFYFDEGNGFVYLGLKNASRILKIRYPDGTVLRAYGKKITEKVAPVTSRDLFCEQHSVFVSNGELYVFNNKGCIPNSVPNLLVLAEDTTAEEGVKKIWEYELPMIVDPHVKSRGGNFIVLPDGSLFTSASSPYSDLIIVDRKKNVLWHAIAEIRNSQENPWTPYTTYRASIVPSNAELHKIISQGL